MAGLGWVTTPPDRSPLYGPGWTVTPEVHELPGVPGWIAVLWRVAGATGQGDPSAVLTAVIDALAAGVAVPSAGAGETIVAAPATAVADPMGFLAARSLGGAIGEGHPLAYAGQLHPTEGFATGDGVPLGLARALLTAPAAAAGSPAGLLGRIGVVGPAVGRAAPSGLIGSITGLRGAATGVGVPTGSLHVQPQLTSFLTAGAYSYAIPSWANFIDVILLGAGGAGNAGGAGFVTGGGGAAGTWVAVTLVRTGAGFPTAAAITGVVGTGGPGGTSTTPGTATTATAAGMTALSAAGGATGAGQGKQQAGYAPGNEVFNGQTYPGGTAGTGNGGAASGNGAGGAGGSGGLFSGSPGGKGAPGAAWFYAYM